MKEQPFVIRYVRAMKRCILLLSCIAIPAIMVCAVFAFLGYIGFWIVTPVALVAYLALYGWYALRVSMGTVIGTEVTDTVVHVKTKCTVYTYDVKSGCIAVRQKKNCWIATFRTQTSQDSFIFYRRAPFSRPYETAFTQEDIDAFWHEKQSSKL